jgi:hypothetical protein
MYYIRYTDRDLVAPAEHSLDCSTELNLFWRLPYPDEDDVRLGEYQPYDRTEELINKDGMYYHDKEDISENCDHMGHVVFESIKNHKLSDKDDNLMKLMPVIRCTACGQLWRTDWEDIRDYVSDDLQARLDRFFMVAKVAEKTVKTVVMDTIVKHLKDSIICPDLSDDLHDVSKEIHEWVENLADGLFEAIGQEDCKHDIVG